MLIFPDTRHEVPLGDISPLKLKAIKHLISLRFCPISTSFNQEKSKKTKILHVYHNYAFDSSLINKNPQVANFQIRIEFDANITCRIVFELLCKNDFFKIKPNYVNKALSILINYVEAVILGIKQLVLSSPIIMRKVRTLFLLRYMDYSGSYSLGSIKVDFGEKVGDFVSGKICLCEFPFEVVCIPKNELVTAPSIDNAFESVERNKQLLQFFLRAPIEDINIGEIDLKKVNQRFSTGKGKECNEEQYEGLSYTSFERNHIGLSYCISDLMKAFMLLPYKLQSVFIDSCSMYSEALKAPPNEAITNFVIVLENLCKYIYPQIKSSNKRFTKMFSEYCEESLYREETGERFYLARCSYAHDAMVFQNLYQKALNELLVSKDDVVFLERIVHRAMISWIRRNTNES